jgi:hypothetical protein
LSHPPHLVEAPTKHYPSRAELRRLRRAQEQVQEQVQDQAQEQEPLEPREPEFTIPSQVSPLDDPDFQVPPAPDLPPIPVQAVAAEDEPGFEAPAARPVPRHAATGPVPMVSASRSSLAGSAAVPGEAARQRAVQVRSMLSGLRSGAERGRADAEAQGGADGSIPPPRNANQPEQ